MLRAVDSAILEKNSCDFVGAFTVHDRMLRSNRSVVAGPWTRDQTPRGIALEIRVGCAIIRGYDGAHNAS